MPETLEQRLARLRSGTAAPVAPDGLEARLNVLRAQAVATPHTEDDLPPDATLSPRALEGTRDLMDLEPPSASQSLAPSPTLFAPKDETFSSADVRHSLNTPAPEPFNLGGSPVAPLKRPPPIAKGPGPTHPSDVVADLVHPLPDGTVVTPRQPSEREQQMASYRIPAVRPDATEPAAPTGTNQDILTRRVSSDVAPINQATEEEINRPTTTLGKVANMAGSMAAHPVQTVEGIAKALPEAGLTLGKFAAQEERKTRGDWRGEDVVSPKDAAFAAGQLLASGATEAALPIIDAFFGKQALNGVKAALENGEPPAVAVAKGYAARVAVHAAAGGAIGASFAPDDPTTGALLGAMIGGIHAAASSQKVGIVSKLGPTATMERPLAPDAAPAPDYSVAVDRGRQLLPENPIHDERPSVELPVSPASWQDRAAATLFDKRYPPGVGNGQGAPITPEEGEQLRQSVAAAQATRLTAPPNPDALAPDALPDVTAIADATKLVGPYEWLSQIQQRIGRGDEISARSLGDLARSILATHAASQPDLEPATIPSHEEARASSAVDQGSVIPDVAQGSGGVSLPTRASRAVQPEAPAGPALAELPQLQGVVGHDSNVLLSDGRRIKTQYAVVEGDQIHPSHDPESFENNPSYPANVQGREYKGPRGEQARQRVMTGALDTDVVLDRGGGLTDGPPLITPHGIVTAGNDRSMRILRAYRLNPEDAQRYREQLVSRAGEYGTSPEDIQAMHRPVLVRVINDPSVNVNSPETLQSINRVSDQTPTKTKDQYSDALSRAKAMQQATASMQHLSETMDPEGSINEYLSGAHGVDFVRKLVEDGVITKQELPSFITRTARAVSVNHEGRQRITDMLNAAAVGDADVLAQAPPETIKKIQTSIPAIIAASHAGDYALGPTLRGALSVFAEAAAKRGELADKGFRTKKASIEAILSQGEMFDQFSPDVAGLARMLEAMPQKDIADAMREYARLAQSSSTASQSHDMFGATPETPEELRARIFAKPENTVQEIPNPYELFELAQKNPTGPEAKQLAAQDAVIAFGSEEAKQAVAKQLAPHLAQLKARGIPTASERQSFVGRMRLREPRIDLTGADVSTPQKMRAALSVMRHPLGESLSIFFKGDESGYEAGRALDHFVYSSGVLNMVAFDMKALAKEIVARAKELGVTTIAAGHNHPSGDPSFSDADHGWSLHLGRLLQEDGVHLEGHMTTDHDVGEWATPHPDMGTTKKMHVERVEIPGVDSREWETAVQRGDEELNAANVGRLTRDVVDPKGVTAIYRDAGGRIIAVESRPFGERPADLLAHTDTQRGRLAARDVILATPYPDGLRAEALSQRRAGLSSGHYVTDILQVTPNGKEVPTVVSSIELGKFPRPDYAWIRTTERRRAQNATRVVPKDVPSGRTGESVSGRAGERAEVRPLHDRVTEPDLFGNEMPEEKKARLNKPVDYTKAISAEEMAQRAKQGETRQAVASITGEEPLKASKDERQMLLLEGTPKYEMPISLSKDDIPLDLAYDAYRWNSMSPDRRAAKTQQDYLDHLRAVYQELRPLATTPEAEQELAAQMGRYKEGYLKRISAWLGAMSRVASPMVTGPANFNTRRNERANQSERNRLDEFLDWSKRAQAAMWKALAPAGEGGPISSDDPEAITALKAKAERLTALQEKAKAYNRLAQKSTNREELIAAATKLVAELAELGFERRTVKELVDGDVMGNRGFPGYWLSNNNAKIKAAKDRIADLEKRRGQSTQVRHFDGGRLVGSVEDNRVQIFFDGGKPPDAVRDDLKARGFRWAPSAGAWQRQLTNSAISASKEIIAKHYAWTAAPEQAVPTPTEAIAEPAPVVPVLPDAESHAEAPRQAEYAPVEYEGEQGKLLEGEKDYTKGIRPIGSASMPPVDEPHRVNLFGEAPDDSPIKGFKNAATNLDRDVMGMDERARVEPRTQDEMYDAGKALAAKDPGAMDRLLQELRNNPEKIAGSKEEAGLLLKKRVDLENELKALIDRKDEAVNEDDQPAEQMARLQLQEKRAEIKEFVQLAERTGTATARALAARKMMSALDYSLSHMEAMSEAAKGSPLTDQELAKVKALHDELTEKLAVADKDVAEAKERAAVAEAELHHAKMRLEVAGPLAERITAKLDKASQAAMARIRARGLRASAGMDPEDLADHAIIGAAELAKGAVAFSEWSDTMLKKLGAYVKPHLDEIFQASNTKLDTEINGVTPVRPQTHARMKSAADIRARLKARAFDGDTLMELRDYLRRLALEHIRSGITKREPLLDALHKDVEQAVPGISRREVRDALSGYGDFKPLDKSADKTRLREIQAESQKLAQLEALQHGKAPLASGFERQPPSDEARRLTQQVNAAKKAAGITQDREGQLRSALNSAKTRVRNSIKDLQTEIDTGQRIVRGKTSLIGDAELDTLKAQLADLRKTEEQVFGKNTMTDAQRLAMAIRMSKANSDRWAERLQKARTGVFDVKTQARQSTSPMIDALRAQAKAAKAEYDELKAHDPEQQRIKADTQNMAYRTRLARQEADLLDRIAREDYGPRPVKPGMIPDRQTVEKKAQVEAVKQRYNELNHQWELSQRTPLQKGIDRWTSFVRFGALSWPSVIGKLTSVALTRTITTPITDAVAVGVAHALPRLADGAPRYGNSSVRRMIRAEAAAQTAMWVDGLKSSGQLLRNRRSRLELLHGKEKLPPAMSDYMGRLHAALKEPIKEAEYARSLLLRTEQAALSGEDVTSPVVQLRLSTEAYLDAERAVSMNSNVITDAWNSALRRLEQKEKATGKPSPLGMLLSAAARTEMPVVKAPTNVVLEAGEIIAGLPIGGARAAWAYAHGIEDLTPVERDSILRMIAKGSIGLAIMALYFYKHDTIDFGGFYQPGEKRKPSDIPAGGMRIVGHTVPASLVHNPFFAAGEFAASIARVAPKKLRVHGKEKEGYVNALAAATFGLIDETPILGSLVDEARDIKDPKTRNEFIAKRVSSLAVPGMVQWVAKKADDDTPRKPKGLVEHLEANIPGLRDRVPTVKQRARQAILQRRMAR